MSKCFKKMIAVLSAIALVVTSITVYNNTAKADTDYSTLTYTSDSSSDVAVAALEDFPFQAVNFLGDGRIEIMVGVAQGSYKIWPDFKDVTLNGEPIDAAYYATGAAFYIPADRKGLQKDAYNVIEGTSNVETKQFHIIVKYGNPAGGGDTPTTSSSTDPQPSNPGGEVEPSQTTSNIPSASTLPKKAAGLNPQVKTDTATIDNSVLLAWASVMEKENPEYDASVYTYNAYVYKNGAQIMKICNVTAGCILGGLSAGTYGFAVAAVNAMGEGPKSDIVNATITGFELNYTPKAEYNGPKIPAGFAIVSADETFQSTVPEEEQKNQLRLAWAASNADAKSPSYDLSVTGYNVYVFDAVTGKPYRRVHIDGIDSNTANLKSVSAGKYVAFVTAVNAQGESGMAAPGLTLASSVEIKGDVLDNAQDFDYPDAPELPLGLVINGAAEGVGSGFSIAWSSESNLNGIRLNVFVDGVCVKAGANSGSDPTYHETRIKPGTYEVSVTAQYISNNVESVPLTKTVTVTGEGTDTPEQMADSTYSKYEKPAETMPSETVKPTEPEDKPTETITDKPTETATDKPTDKPTNKPTEKPTIQPSTETPGNNPTQPSVNNPGENANNSTTSAVSNTTKPSANVFVGKTKVKKASKKKTAKKAKISLKKVKEATGYKIQISKSKKFKKIIVTKNVKKASVTIKNKKLKNKKKLYIRAKAYRVVNGNTYEGAWSKPKKFKIKK